MQVIVLNLEMVAGGDEYVAKKCYSDKLRDACFSTIVTKIYSKINTHILNVNFTKIYACIIKYGST